MALHEEYADEILAAMDNYIKTGTPVNPPVWWADTTDDGLYRINDRNSTTFFKYVNVKFYF